MVGGVYQVWLAETTEAQPQVAGSVAVTHGEPVPGSCLSRLPKPQVKRYATSIGTAQAESGLRARHDTVGAGDSFIAGPLHSLWRDGHFDARVCRFDLGDVERATRVPGRVRIRRGRTRSAGGNRVLCSR
jgi:sugar/nucleoside kinase (ribokinase family)